MRFISIRVKQVHMTEQEALDTVECCINKGLVDQLEEAERTMTDPTPLPTGEAPSILAHPAQIMSVLHRKESIRKVSPAPDL
jgi:hypothetical protein